MIAVLSMPEEMPLIRFLSLLTAELETVAADPWGEKFEGVIVIVSQTVQVTTASTTFRINYIQR